MISHLGILRPTDRHPRRTWRFALVGALVVLLVVGAVYVWYAVTLSRCSASSARTAGRRGCRSSTSRRFCGWGASPRWSVIFYVIPVVGLYGLYLKATALVAGQCALRSRRRIDGARRAGCRRSGRPCWPAVPLAPDPGLQERIATSVEPRSGYAFAVSTPQQPGRASASAADSAGPRGRGSAARTAGRCADRQPPLRLPRRWRPPHRSFHLRRSASLRRPAAGGCCPPPPLVAPAPAADADRAAAEPHPASAGGRLLPRPAGGARDAGAAVGAARPRSGRRARSRPSATDELDEDEPDEADGDEARQDRRR